MAVVVVEQGVQMQVHMLVLDNAVLASGGAMFAAELPQAARWSDLSIFEQCIAAAARRMGA